MRGEAMWDELRAELREVALLHGAAAALAWDQQTYLPPGSATLRGQQLGLLSRMVHERQTAPRYIDLVRGLAEAELAPTQRVAIERLEKDLDRSVRVPSSLVERAARASASGFEAWMRAKQSSDFSIFAPWLEEHLAIARERAAAIDGDAHPLAVLMEGFDPGVSIDSLRATFARLRDGLAELIGQVDPADDRSLGGHWPVDAQRALHREVAAALGYDFQRGRIDLAEHPFTIALGHDDVRITTHLYADDLLGGLGGTVHESGHALYEQGLPRKLEGTGLDQAASFGVHESQSRLWENAIGRSRAFFEWLLPRLDAHFPGHGRSVDDLYRAANRIQPGPIRVTADEVTYNLHIIIRFELELALFEGSLTVAELPGAWDELYQRYLGVRPPDAARGVLQDVHWSSGSFAYFQSYTLGNLYAASQYAVLREAMPQLDDDVRAGRFAPVLGWLREHIHARGRALDGGDLVREAVGDRDMVSDLLGYLWERHGALYGLRRAG